MLSSECESSWLRALTLAERLGSTRGAGSERPDPVDADLAERRLREWRSQAPFLGGALFDQRLLADDISEEELRHLLGEPAHCLQARLTEAPLWLAELSDAFTRPGGAPMAADDARPVHPMRGFLHAIDPLVNQGRERLHDAIRVLCEAHPDAPFRPATIERLTCGLPEQLLARMCRTMVLELHVARLKGELHGATAADRFQDFVLLIRDRETALAILQEYPVLARQLMLCVNQWVDSTLEFLGCLCADWKAIRAALCPGDDPGALVEVDGGAGDRHRGGRSVLIAKFSSGLRIVYKPRSFAVDVHFQELLEWLNERGDHPPFRTLRVLDRGSYGWMEFVSSHGCSAEDEVRRFYERQGGYLALLYALGATDFHSENLIAAGEHPLLLDLEALFHPRLGEFDSRYSEEIAGNFLFSSVLNVGLLPVRIWSNAQGESIDLSGLGNPPGQVTPYGLPHWSNAGTDEMQLTKKRMTFPTARNRPSLNGADVDALAHSESIVKGFTRIYDLILEHRNDLLSPDGPLARFAQDEVRVIVRNTRTYAMLLHECFHPDVLRDALDRECLFDRLWGRVEQLPYLAKVIRAEREDLQNGDVPLFTTRPGSRDLWTSSHERIAGFCEESGMSLVTRRVRALSSADRVRQLWIVRASLGTLARGEKRALQPVRRGGDEPHAPIGRRQLLEAARGIGDRLDALTLRGDNDVCWLGLTFMSDGHWTLAPMLMDLYDGVSGVAFFLAYLGAVSGESRYTALARSTLTTLRRLVERQLPALGLIGGFTGWGGVIYTLTHLAVLWDEPALLREAEAIVEHLPKWIDQDDQLDIVGGSAGCLLGLVNLYQCAPSDRTLAAAVQCGDRLLANAQRLDAGIGWVLPKLGPRPLAGFSHGAAGMAWALASLAELTGETRFSEAAAAAIAYERSLFSPRHGNWADQRDAAVAGRSADGDEDYEMVAWCHGAPGIGLARLRHLGQLDDPTVRAEIDVALETTRDRGFGHNHSLCHGDLGNLDLLLEAGHRLNDPRWRAEVDRLASVIVGSMERGGWVCGNPLGVESPGLMTGLAGIGYGLLRLAEPRLPSILTLAPPVQLGDTTRVPVSQAACESGAGD